MGTPGRKAVLGAAVAAAVGVSAGWVGGSRPWEGEPPGVNESPDGSSSVVLTDVQSAPDQQYRFVQWWTDGQSVRSLTPTDDGMLVMGDRESWGDQPPWRFATSAKIRPADIAALPGSPTGPWVALGDTTSASASGSDAAPALRSWSGQWPDQPGDRLAKPIADTLPAKPARTKTSGSILSGMVSVAAIGGRPMALAAYSQEREDAPQPRTRGLTLCPDAQACRWGAAQRLPYRDEFPLDVASTGTGFVLLTAGATEDEASGVPSTTASPPSQARVWFADDRGLTWRNIGLGPIGARLTAAIDSTDGVLLLWRTRPEKPEPVDDAGPSTSPAEPEPDTLSVQRVTPQGELVDEVPALPLPEDTGYLTSVGRFDGEWVVGGGTRRPPEWADLRYDSDSALLLRRGQDGWVDTTPEVLRHQPDETVQVIRTDEDGDTSITLSSTLQRTTSTWQWVPAPTDED